MTLETHKADIMRALSEWKGRPEPVRFQAKAWAGITHAAEAASASLEEYRARSDFDRSGTLRRDDYDALVKHTEATLAAFKKVTATPYLAEPLGWADGWDVEDEAGVGGSWVDWAGTEEKAQTTIRDLETALDWAKRARDQGTQGVVRGRPMSPESVGLTQLAHRLGVVFQHHTMKAPTMAGGGSDTHFEHFVTVVAHAMGWDAEPDTVKAAIRRVNPKGSLVFQLDVMQEATRGD